MFWWATSYLGTGMPGGVEEQWRTDSSARIAVYEAFFFFWRVLIEAFSNSCTLGRGAEEPCVIMAARAILEMRCKS